jgi:hypothetical protein
MATNGNSRADAEEKMNAAQAALLAYVESEEHYPVLQKRLIDDVNRAIADYETFVGQEWSDLPVVSVCAYWVLEGYRNSTKKGSHDKNWALGSPQSMHESDSIEELSKLIRADTTEGCTTEKLRGTITALLNAIPCNSRSRIENLSYSADY